MPQRLGTRYPTPDVTTLIMCHAVILHTPMISAAGIKHDIAAFGPFAAPMSDDFVMLAEAAHTLFSPAIAITGRLATTIEQSRDLGVWHQSGQFADEGDRIVGNARMMPTGRVKL